MQWMTHALHPPSIYPEIIAHTTLSLMTKLTDYTSFRGASVTSKEQDDALLRAWIRSTEVQLLERRIK